MAVAAFVGDVDDFGVGIREDLPRAQQSQFGLPGAKGDAELLVEEAAERFGADLPVLAAIRRRLCN